MIGETVVLGNNVSILHSVTLGGGWARGKGPIGMSGGMCRHIFACKLRPNLLPPHEHTITTSSNINAAAACTGTGKEDGDRHPKISDNVLIGACSRILGNIRVGHSAQVAAGSLVLREVPPRTLVGGAPAIEIGRVIGATAGRVEAGVPFCFACVCISVHTACMLYACLLAAGPGGPGLMAAHGLHEVPPPGCKPAGTPALEMDHWAATTKLLLQSNLANDPFATSSSSYGRSRGSGSNAGASSGRASRQQRQEQQQEQQEEGDGRVS